MVNKIPLNTDSRKATKDLRNTLLRLFDGRDATFDGKPIDRASLQIPDYVDIGSATLSTRSSGSGNSLGAVVTFRNGGPFATIHFWYDPEDGGGYSLGGYAGWDCKGSRSDLMDYYVAIDDVFHRLGQAAGSHRISCPCGTTRPVSGGYRAVAGAISDHYDDDHDERRISTSTLIGMGVSVAEGASRGQNESGPEESEAVSA